MSILLGVSGISLVSDVNHVARPNVNKGSRFCIGGSYGGSDLERPVGSDSDGGSAELIIVPEGYTDLPA